MIALTPEKPLRPEDHAPQSISRQTASTAFDPLEILHGFRRRGLIAALVGMPLALLASIVVFASQSPKYKASALLRLSSQETSLVFEDAEGTDFQIFQGTQKALVRTRLVMTAALRNMSDSDVLQLEKPVEWMLDNVKVDTPANTEIMTIGVTATKDADPVEVVNATVDAYVVEVVNRVRDTRQRRLAGIEDVFSKKQAESRKRRNELRRITEELGTGDEQTLALAQQMKIQELSFVRTKLIELQSTRSTRIAELKSLEALREIQDGEIDEEDIVPTEADIDTAIARDTIYNSLVTDKVNLSRAALEAQLAFKDSANIPLKSLNRQTDLQMDQRVDQIKEVLLAVAPLKHRARVKLREQELNQRAAQIRAELDVLEELRGLLSDDETRLTEEFKQVGNQSIEVETMRRDIAQLDAVLASIAQQREELKVELQSRPRVEVLRKAEEMQSSDFIGRAGLAGFSGIAAFCFPGFLLLLFDLLGRKVNSSSGLADGTGLEILGTLPAIPNAVLKRLGDDKNRRAREWHLRLSESVKRIASRLSPPLDPDGDSTAQVYLVTSAARGEGKTTVANQLATSLAQSTRKVILCDFDLRRPKLHRVHGLSAGPGVCDVLRSEVNLADALQETTTERLLVLPAGNCCKQAIRALVEEKAEPLIKELRGMADVVIIDACSVLSSADLDYLCPHVDEIIFAARRDFSRTPDVVKALRLIPATEEQIAGAVVIEKDNKRVDAVLER